MHIIQSPLFDFEAFICIKSNDRLVIVLEALDAQKLLVTLEREHWTGRKGYMCRPSAIMGHEKGRLPHYPGCVNCRGWSH